MLVEQKKFLMKFALICLTLTLCSAALADPYKIEVGPGWIKGHANATPLSKVLGQLAEDTGYTIYLDETLQNTPVTFSIKEDMEPEKAIRRIVQPNSYAVVFGSEADRNGSYILEVKVFSEGRMNTARYMAFQGGNGSISTGSGNGSKKNSGSQPSALCSLGTTDSGYSSDSGRSLQGKNMLRPNLEVTRNPYGGPVIRFRDPRKGPNYRPSAYEMRKSYVQYQQAKQLEQMRKARSLSQQAHMDDEQQKQSYRNQLNGTLKQYVKNENSK
jgi:hypothetical protein